MGWAKMNKLVINEEKTLIISFCKGIPRFTARYYLNGKCIKRVKETSDLGIIFDEKLTFLPHIQRIYERCRIILHQGIKLCREMNNREMIIKIYSVYIQPLIDYGRTQILHSKSIRRPCKS